MAWDTVWRESHDPKDLSGHGFPYFSDLQEGELGEELKLTASAVEQGGLDYLETLAPGTVRVTWVAGDGTVLYDSEATPAAARYRGRRSKRMKGAWITWQGNGLLKRRASKAGRM